MEVMKVFKEMMPDVKLIGKRYTNADRGPDGTFSRYWEQCFTEGWTDTLRAACAGLEDVSNAYVGAMRMLREDEFEYWIGAFFAPDDPVPEGFESVDIPAGEIGVCWLYGSDKNGELYGMEASRLCMVAMDEEGWDPPETGWFFERYTHPRFTVPDEHGMVILDICAYI